MPTSYTEAVKDGITFENFAMRCARGMGAPIMMRDAPFDAPIPESLPVDDYHQRCLDGLRTQLFDLQNLSDAEITVQCNEDYESALANQEKYISADLGLLSKYEAMLSQVQAWAPPSEDHQGFKNFMVSQLEESIRFDCGHTRPGPIRVTEADWFTEQLAIIERGVEYHTAKYAEEVERTSKRNLWLRQLRESLGV